MPDAAKHSDLQNALEELFTPSFEKKTPFHPLAGAFAFYGAGGLGKLGYQLFEKIGIKPTCFLDMNRESSQLYGIPVRHPEDLPAADKEPLTVVISVVNNPVAPIAAYLKSLGYRNIRYFYDVTEAYREGNLISNGWFYGDPTPEDREKIPRVFHRLADDRSRCAYLQMLYWRLKREEKVFCDYRPDPGTKWYPPDIIPQGFTPEVMLDGGTHDGSILLRHIEKVGTRLEKILAFEPDPDNFDALRRGITELPGGRKDHIEIHRLALGENNATVRFAPRRDLASCVTGDGDIEVRQISIDSLNLRRLDLIKLHIEGSEYPAVCGGIETFQRCRPAMALTIYHNTDGLWKIQEFLFRNLDNYRFYIRLHAYCGIGCILYAVPGEL
ncbi:SAM-dependent methyltransferase, putative [Syntrophotalea carbinolica DSM 2380]|uniref:SAM-dependent methyltransferase, putative n=1 Tax=Syntrophotalea carbinolica (strain DSM 2380 / NBRC 103641 / GraBd1) TaxID=338963 RepID=Q3A5I1_SYNC1|nr:FkbM family methyltransferase [Syntrophotalea carbinolica]ABA88376.1 SAM-dependent methyltransferase, putative [Syntrophotalea carbinolica DSM 2380]